MLKLIVMLLTFVSSISMCSGSEGLDLLLAAASQGSSASTSNRGKSNVIAHLIGVGGQKLAQSEEMQSKKRSRSPESQSGADVPSAKKQKEQHNHPDSGVPMEIDSDVLKKAYALLANVISKSTRDENQRTPLILAVQKNDKDSACMLLSGNLVEINAQDISGKSALHYAAESGNVAIAQELLKAHASCDISDQWGVTPLHGAAAAGHIEMVQLLISSGASIEKIDNSHYTALHRAAMSGQEPVIKLLLEKGANKEAQNIDQATPLLCAACGNKLNAVKQLIDAGANITAQDKNGNTALDCAVYYNCTEIVNLFMQTNIDENVLLKAFSQAAYSNNMDMCKLILNTKAPAGVPDAFGKTAFDNAVNQKNSQMIAVFIKFVDKEHIKKVLLEALEKRDTKLIKLLLESGVDINSEIKNKSTLLHLAAEKGHFNTVKLLIEKGANKELRDHFSTTALHRAAYCQESDSCNHVKIVKLLLDAKADNTAKDQFDNLPMHYACDKGNSAIVKLLLATGAGANSKNKKQETPFYVAANKDKNKIAELLLANKADVEIAPTDGKPIINYLANNNKLELIPAILEYGAQIVRPLADLQEINAIRKALDLSADDKCLILCTLLDNARYIKTLLNSGLISQQMLTKQDSIGMTALMWAAARGNKEIVGLLLDYNSKAEFINTGNKKGETALMLAKKHGHKDIESMIIKFDKDKDVIMAS